MCQRREGVRLPEMNLPEPTESSPSGCTCGTFGFREGGDVTCQGGSGDVTCPGIPNNYESIVDARRAFGSGNSTRTPTFASLNGALSEMENFVEHGQLFQPSKHVWRRGGELSRFALSA